MTQWHTKASTKISGGKRMTLRRSDKRLAWKGGDAALTTIAPSDDDNEEIEARVVEGLGSTEKIKLRHGKYATATEAGKANARKYEILSVVENPADAQFARRNIITKGAVLKAKDGASEVHIRVTSRPGQNGSISGILIKDYRAPKEIKAETKKAKKAPKTPKKAETRQNNEN